MNLKKNTGILLSVVTMGILAAIAPCAHASQCTQQGVAGKYGFTLNGVVALPTGAIPIAAVGAATIDVKGNVTGTESRSVGGDYADETMQGTLTVGANCTGSMTVQFYEAGQLVRTSVLSIVFDENQREVRMVQKSLELPNGSFLPVVITVDAKKMFTQDED